jgi:hypothetical protein
MSLGTAVAATDYNDIETGVNVRNEHMPLPILFVLAGFRTLILTYLLPSSLRTALF